MDVFSDFDFLINISFIYVPLDVTACYCRESSGRGYPWTLLPVTAVNLPGVGTPGRYCLLLP